MKVKFNTYLYEFLLAILAGMSISIGCIAFLSSGNKIAGALFFTVGLFMVCNFKFNLFTGKVCYSLENKPNYILKLLVIWIGNFCGALIMAGLCHATRLTGLMDSAQILVNVKLADNVGSLFVLGIFCNIMIYLAVHGYAKFDNALAKFMALLFGVSIFVLCGFEHCVADMFYFVFVRAWSWEMIGKLVMITLGNIVGGLFIPAMTRLIEYLKAKTDNKK